ncbi:integrase [Geobacillus sp. NFOSA3]|uniref:Integrase n=1 Tax=Parageobacillus galactosidasius TaxID=883812 RepID=A0A226QKF0_9BACL|nr:MULTISPECIES: tyrosine-type recombinase/integrase [Parageobacillus]NNU92423.1 integrase [Geobacillus sp. NFOSA3]AEH46356.1 integrase family protein [Parageobacillus thermoglucosidasius C56-YS93]MBY6269925.1 integrase [Parageobacillus thermoglucosidasius]OUM83791.1 MAG: integrase [Parageobacillus thermoglucosidasius]OXB93023.1 integrase [Parageobacillus galactosidasius]
MQNYVTPFIGYLYEEAKDEKTIASYRTTVVHFLTWKEQRDGEYIIEETRPIDIKEYISYLKHQCKRKPATINKYIAALKVFFAFLLSSGIIKDNPMTRIKVEKLDYANGANQTKWLTKEEQDRFISYVQLEPNEFKRLRNLAIIDLMLYSGLRVNEVSSLEINDIITKDKDVQVIIREGKGNKFATVILVQKHAKNLRKWLKYRKGLDKDIHKSSPRLFVSERSPFFTERGIQKMLNKYAELANMDHITPHRFRHSFCKNLANAGTPIELIRRLARHESIQTTAIYLESSQEEQIEALRKV